MHAIQSEKKLNPKDFIIPFKCVLHTKNCVFCAVVKLFDNILVALQYYIGVCVCISKHLSNCEKRTKKRKKSLQIEYFSFNFQN